MSELFKSPEGMHGATHAEAAELVGRLFEVAQPGAVFAEPVTVEGRTVITASEVTVGMGIGFGAGGGGGGGGGGGASGRPVAVVIIEPAGVRVEPIVDVTKLGLAMFTTLGGMLLMIGRMRRVGKR